eukprot:TRINITY_DN9759_c0_g1_i1.p1 TRINITY_DN9759_c0_g1~~TRINITY_DN9759_c0_g1_i1.p1  ORF type:complete len:780 (-),score=81.96 TRINITY_DN9759_c0_g1_i1:52-2391(-)
MGCASHGLLLRMLIGLWVICLTISFVESIEKCSSLGITVSETVLPKKVSRSEVEKYRTHNPYRANTGFIVTEDGGFWKTIDQGESWDDQAPKISNFSTIMSPYFALAGVLQFQQTWNPRKVWLLGNSGFLWTLDGDNYTQVWSDVADQMYTTYILPHPLNPDRILVQRDTFPCRFPTVRGICRTDLYLSIDFGASWKVIERYVKKAVWGLNDTIVVIAAKTQNSQMDQREMANSSYVARSSDNLYVTTKEEASNVWDVFTVPLPNSFDTKPEHPAPIVIAQLKGEDNTKLFVSLDNGVSFTETLIPSAVTKYFLIEASGDMPLIGLDSREGDNFTSLYYSDMWDNDFALSVDGVKLSKYGLDAWVIKGLDSTVIINSYMDPTLSAFNSTLRSFITFTSGVRWHLIRPPGECAEGEDGCSLNFVSRENKKYSSLLDFHTIPGKIAGVGDIGLGLDTESNSLATYYSMDGGITWRSLGPPSQFMFGDNGGLFVMTASTGPITRLSYTWNDGVTINSCEFTEVPTEITYIMPGIGISSSSMVLLGARQNENDTNGVLIEVDFSKSLPRKCQGIENAGNETSDFEYWTPDDPYSASQCLNGERVVYVRRKRGVACYLGEDYQSVVTTESCPCSLSDYECEYCFDLDEATGECKLICHEVPDFSPAADECKNEDFYWSGASGYRLIAGNTCQGGLELRMKHSCQRHVGGIAPALLTLFSFIGLSVALFITLYMKNRHFYNWLHQKFPKAFKRDDVEYTLSPTDFTEDPLEKFKDDDDNSEAFTM